MVTSRLNRETQLARRVKTLLVEIDFFSNRFATHVTNLERFGALRAGSVSAEEGNIAAALHADAAAMRFFDFHDFAFEVAESVGGRLPIVLGVEQLFPGNGNTPLNVHTAGETLFHTDATLFARDLMLTGVEDDQDHDFITHDAFLRKIGYDWGAGGQDCHRGSGRIFVRVLPSADML